MVFSGLVTAWRLAGWPTSRSPSSVKATIEGVVRIPSAFSMTFGVLPSITATQELVVPRSMPMTLPMASIPLFGGRSAGPGWRPDGGMQSSKTSSDPLRIHVKRRPRGVQPHIGGPHWAARRTVEESDSWATRHASVNRLSAGGGDLPLPDRAVLRHLEGEAEARQVF